MRQHKVTFQPEGYEIEIVEGSSVMEALNTSKINFDFPCGGKGKCGKCRVRVSRGANEPNQIEQDLIGPKARQEGVRLACVTKINSDLTIEVDFNNDSKHQILQASEKTNVEIKPQITKTLVEVETPSLNEYKSDWARLKEALYQKGYSANLSVKLSALFGLPENLRDAKHRVTVVASATEVLGVEQGDTTQKLLGMAFDIGTTTIVGYLIDLTSGREVSVVSTVNPQAKYGADVISRISFASDRKGLEKLHGAVIETINKLICQASQKAGVSEKDIYALTIAGNTTMHHLFVGMNPKYLSVSPYVSVSNDPLELNPQELELSINEAGKVLVLPNIAGFVGADTVAVLLATELDKSKEIKLIVDIGTNGEIVLGSGEKMYSCSAAAGPAFEGAEITCGMRGADGAIDHVYFREKLEYTVIGLSKPRGICGSALLDVVAGLIEVGIINNRGKLLSSDKITNPEAERFKENLIEYEGEQAFLLVEGSNTEHGRSIVITQNDVRQLQLAKGAMVAGIKILFEKCEVSPENVKEVLLAGAFGNYMNPHSACLIGLIPKELEDKIKLIGNAAGTGSRLALQSADEYKRAAQIAKSVDHVELASFPNFKTIFAKSTYFN